jgi:hypothetical protein
MADFILAVFGRFGPFFAPKPDAEHRTHEINEIIFSAMFDTYLTPMGLMHYKIRIIFFVLKPFFEKEEQNEAFSYR